MDASMSCEEVCSYLERKGIGADDLKKIADGGYDGQTLPTLCRDESELNQVLSEVSIIALKTLIPKECEATDELDVVTEPISGHIDFAAYGLGRGVDGSDPHPMNNPQCSVRNVLPPKSPQHYSLRTVLPENLQQIKKDHTSKFNKVVSKMKKRTSSVGCSVSDLIGKIITLSLEAAYSSEKLGETEVTVEKKTTRCVQFREMGRHADTVESNFVQSLCEWLVDEIPELAHQPSGYGTASDQVESYLRSKKETEQGWQNVLTCTYKFITTKKITHYVSELNLGAASYYFSFKKNVSSETKATFEVGTDYVAGVKAGRSHQMEKRNEQKKRCTIGDIETVDIGKGECAIGYNIQPVTQLIVPKYKNIREVMKRATDFYLNRFSGPFLISYEKDDDNDAYWTVANAGINNNKLKKVIIGTEKRQDAAIFYIERRKCSDKFAICYKGEQLGSDKRKRSPQYIKMRSKMAKLDHGPIQIGGSKAAHFTLRHPAKVPSIELWEKESCYIKLSCHKLKKKCYVAFDSNGTSSQSMCAHCIEEGENMGFLMRFKLNHVGISSVAAEDSRDCFNMSQKTRRIRCDGDDDDDDDPISRRIRCDGDDDDDDPISRRIWCDDGDVQSDVVPFTLDRFEADCKHYGEKIEEDSDPEDSSEDDEGENSDQEDHWGDEEVDSGPDD